MRSQRNSIWMGLCLAAIFLMACSLGGILEKVKGNNADDRVVDSGLYRSETGGYEFQPLEDYELTDSFGIIQLLAPGANPQAGPAILLVGGLNDYIMDNDALVEKLMADTPDAEFSKPKKVKVDGLNGYDLKVTSTYEGEALDGRMVMLMVTPYQQFAMVGVAPKGEWKQVNKDFEKVLESVRFFDADPYAYTDQNSYEETGDSSPKMLRQWAIYAQASAEYSSEEWSALRAVGEPDVLECSDDPNAWASDSATSIEWIELVYDVPVIPYEVTIVQNYNPSQVVEVTGITEDGTEYLIWESQPEYVGYCPDWMTISIEPQNEVYINTLRIVVDQSVLGIGWIEIDAIEMVGIPQGMANTGVIPQPGDDGPGSGASGFSQPEEELPPGQGFLATDAYQAYLAVPINQIADLEKIIGPLKSSSGQLKPRPDHMDTYVFDIGEGMQAYVAVTTSGLIYKKNIGQIYPVEMGVIFDRGTYDALIQLQKDSNYELPYSWVATMLGSPGLLIWQQITDDGKMRAEYNWFNDRGDRLFVASYDGLITGSAGISFVPAE